MSFLLANTRKILAIGRNYAEHAKELNNPLPTSPVIFLKPSSSIIRKGQSIVRPTRCKALHHEIELGLVIGQKGKFIKEKDAMDHIAGYVVALDMTARDLQDAAKSKGLPWTEAKGHDTFCPLGEFIPKAEIPDPHNVELWLKVAGESTYRQKGSTSDMIFRIPWLVSYLSNIMTLEEGDLILTGTPAGVSGVEPGSTLVGGITGLPKYDIQFSVTQQQPSAL
uniref:Fumarylacetoacetase-like C-terminal domain-containing protein n=1 Tax=Arcella intermedia TaxID=1963864 RepID=A0A6B2LGQ0_9EUKA